ncbi:unnamed protein product [Effrenium voratum]|nr:unnamed protein product [Effrenium voratum]
MFKRGELAAKECQQQCRGWVDTALSKLESLAVRSREQLATLSGDLPHTVKRLVAEEIARRRAQNKAKLPRDRGSAKLPFELGDPMAKSPETCSAACDVGVEKVDKVTQPVVQFAPPPPMPESPSPQGPRSPRTPQAGDGLSPHAAG